MKLSRRSRSQSKSKSTSKPDGFNVRLAILLMLATTSLGAATTALGGAEVNTNAAVSISEHEAALQYRVIRNGKFTQQKKIIGLSRTLNSSGHFNISEQRVVWTTTAPLYSEVLIADNSVQERYSADSEFQTTASGESVTTVSRILALIVRADTEGLKRYFDVSYAAASYQLIPRGDTLKSLFSKIFIEQTPAAVNVQIHEASGTVTDINLMPSSG